MPLMTHTPTYSSEPSDLVEGVHPAFLMAITEELTPPTWPAAVKALAAGKEIPPMYRWHFAVCPSFATVTSEIPELQTAISTTLFSGGSRPSKAYTWTCTLVGREIPVHEGIDLEPLCPLPCQVFILRHDKNRVPITYANIDPRLMAWPEGAALLTPEVRQKLALWWSMKQSTPVDDPTPPPPASMPPVPSMVQGAPAAPAAPTPAPAPATRQAW
jgi:hypothetical protein